MSLTQVESNRGTSSESIAASASISLVPKEGKFSKPSEWLNLNVFAMSFFHLVAVWTALNVPLTTPVAVFSFLMIYVRMFGLTGGYHRYFSHRSYQTSRVFQFILAVLGGTAFQKGALWWGSHHRYHHKWSDTAHDTHSPREKGFIWSHIGWFLFSKDNSETLWELIPDLARFPELRWLNAHHWVPGFVTALLIYLFGGLHVFLWGFMVSTVFLWHITFCINSLAHVYGSIRYKTSDTSRNSLLLGLLAMGEGWHNNHHAYKSSANNGFFWWEIDMTFYCLLALEKLGVVWDLRRPPLRELAQMKVIPQDATYY